MGGTGETTMSISAKQHPEQEHAVETPTFRAPASVEEAYERGWRWHVESFADLTMFESTVKSVTRREGSTHFKGPEGEIVIPFVATYAFGEPRVPKYPYAGGSVCLIDDDEEHAATLERKASLRIGKATDEEKRPDSPKPTSLDGDFEIKLWKVQYRFRGRVVHTYTCQTPMAEDDAYYAFCDELDLYVSEVKTKSRSARRRTKKTKTRR
jgi:hypothetical protein